MKLALEIGCTIILFMLWLILYIKQLKQMVDDEEPSSVVWIFISAAATLILAKVTWGMAGWYVVGTVIFIVALVLGIKTLIIIWRRERTRNLQQS